MGLSCPWETKKNRTVEESHAQAASAVPNENDTYEIENGECSGNRGS